MPKTETTWNVTMSDEAKRIVNPIRNVCDCAPKSKSTKPLLALSIGDPTLDGNLLTPPCHIEGVQRAVASHKCDGYAPTVGYRESREIIAEYWRKEFVTNPERKKDITWDNVVLTSGGSHAIMMGILSVCNPGDNVLIPAPGYTHYETICRTYNIEMRFYHLCPERNWQVDLNDVRRLVDNRTKLFLITNPSNPCGSNFSKQHVEDLVHLSEELHLPMLSDEIYAGMVFQYQENPYKTFNSAADVKSDAPRLILGGTAKRYLVPGWRLGWLLLVDPVGLAKEYMKALVKESMLIVGPCTLPQGALREGLLETPRSFYEQSVAEIEKSALGFYRYINKKTLLPGKHGKSVQMLEAMLPQGALYAMIKINFEHFDRNVVKDDQSFFEKLLEEDNVQVMPGCAFHAPGYFRVVITRKLEILEEATDRIVEFCQRHMCA